MRKPIETGWPAIGVLTAFLSGIFCGCLLISGDSPEQFYEQWQVLFWGAGALLGLCMLAELTRLKCPYCRSRAIEFLLGEEVDRWLGQKVVTENTISVGAFQTVGHSKFKGITEGIAVGNRTILITKRCILQKHRCKSCEHEFERKIVEEMR